MEERAKEGVRACLDQEEVRSVLEETFFLTEEEPAPSAKAARRKRRTKAKPDHYEVICISLYKEDLARLDEKVRKLKSSGHRKMSRSALIRYALNTVDLEQLPPAY